MILYPTETVYALGVNALDPKAMLLLYDLKGREATKAVSWLVRDSADIERYSPVSKTAEKIIEHFLPGSLTLVLPARPEYSTDSLRTEEDMIGFRISPDPVAQKVIADFMSVHPAPLTCTSANLAGKETPETPEEILGQFAERATLIETVYDYGPRKGTSSTVVRVVGDSIEILREGAITESAILEVL